jgi:NAD(P)H-dependent FMN reductase
VIDDPSLHMAAFRDARHASGVELKIATIRGIPLYDGDVEAAEGIPEIVSALKDAIASADGLLLLTQSTKTRCRE